MSEPGISDVSDTALWVATYRAVETERPDALFKDPLARQLAGDKGRAISAKMIGSRYTAWSVVIRTCIIDGFIGELLGEGIDTVVNLGAGLDTRPYRLSLPASLRWIEADHPHLLDRKEGLLRNERPVCNLERKRVDLGNHAARQDILAAVGATSKKALVITEGVIPYLTEEQVAALAADLRGNGCFSYWIVDYFSPQVFRYMQSPRRMEQMKNAPFRFFPDDWFGFFARHGWQARETTYIAEESLRLGRNPPIPWWAKIFRHITPKDRQEAWKRFSGYSILEPR